MTSLPTLTIDELAAGICLRAGRIAAAQAELLLWIAEFDRREGWAGPGLLSCAHWLAWRVGMSLGTARDQVRVARRLEDLPEVAAAFADGRVSYSKVRAITRVAQPDDGIDWVDLARHGSAAQLDMLVRGVHRARANEQAEGDPEAAQWRLRTRTRYDDRGHFVLTISGPAQLLPVIKAGLDAKKALLKRKREAARSDELVDEAMSIAVPEQDVPVATPPQPSSDPVGVPEHGAADEEPDAQAPGWPVGTTVRQVQQAMDGFAAMHGHLRDGLPEPEAPRTQVGATEPEPPLVLDVPVSVAVQEDPYDAGSGGPTPIEVSDADALMALAQDALDDERSTRPDAARRRRPALTVRIDPLSGWARQADGELLPPSSLRAVMKSLPGRGGLMRLRPVTEADMRACDLGRSAREANAALRELLGAVDGERCRFPGCSRNVKLHAHHVRYWSNGGPTDLANLVLVCNRHHTLLHAQGFQLVLHPDRRLEVRTADGVPVLPHPAQPWGDPAALATGCGQRVSAEALVPDHCDSRLDLHYAVSVLMAQAA